MTKTPRTFAKQVKIRFSDIDRYQHVNTVYYPDYVFTSRFEFLEEKFGISPDHFEKDGIGFFTSRFELKFLKPIAASVSFILVESKVKEIDRSFVKIEFQILDSNKKTLFSKGEFDFYVIDLKTQKPLKELPSSFEALLFEE